MTGARSSSINVCTRTLHICKYSDTTQEYAALETDTVTWSFWWW